MKRIITGLALCGFLLTACGQGNAKKANTAKAAASTKKAAAKTKSTVASYAGKHFEGPFTSGMKGAKISFDISADGKKLNNLTYKGYWHCGGKTEFANYSPDTGYDIIDGKVSGTIQERSTGVLFEFMIDGNITGSTASGTYNMRLNPGNCMTGTITWTATTN